jgi:hypothetical protein
LPDAFSMFVFDSTAAFPLITTDDPTGADALFLFDIHQGAGEISVYAPDQTGFSVSAVPAQAIPEPSSIALLLAGAAAWLAKGGSRGARRRSIRSLLGS